MEDFASEALELSALPGYQELVKAAASNTLTVEKIQATIHQLRSAAEKELEDFKETPQDFISLLAMFIPFYGLIKKWYKDQKRVYIQARIKNYTMILAIFTNSEMVAKKLDEQMATLKKQVDKHDAERRWMK